MRDAAAPFNARMSDVPLDAARRRDPRIDSRMAVRPSLRLAERWVNRLPLAGVTLLSKVGAPKLAALGISFSIPFIYLGGLLGLLTGRLVIDPARFVWFLTMAAVLWLMQFVHGGPFSVLSLLMLCVLHLPYVLGGRAVNGGPERAWDAFRLLASFLAICGIAQYLLQFVIGPLFAFPMDNLLPEPLRVLGFNGQGWIEYGSTTFRSNGVFMLEASFFSQLLAIALVGELLNRALSWKRVALYCAGIVVSYSGTGILSLIVCFPIWMVRQRRWDVAAVLLIAIALFWAVLLSGVANENVFVKVFLDRSREFTSTGSSGFARFVGGFYLFEQFLWPDPLRTLFGFGSGSFVAYIAEAQFPAHGMALFKMVFEFGIVGATAYFGFLLYCFSRSRAPLELRAAIFVPLLIQNYVPFAHGLAFVLLVWSTPSVAQFLRSKA
ncbi:hypothetical protein [Pseudorhodoferax soli]|uniref:O-antigen ligase-like membrane protein n=1 Tax=Pseudorhodoferax soli TaxID=545864 RepID=A0A368Y7H8_9BURK|nr:hypothetical protein [Pseudorhodoferax soli]RCW76045.1 hypothetical protein DES41_101649 [Pseudorhodoferax soli]